MRERIASEAADWFTRLRESDVSREEHSQFALWLLRSPDHIAEYLAVTRAWTDVGLAQGEAFSVETLVQEALATSPPAPNIVNFPQAPPESLRERAAASKAFFFSWRSVAVFAVAAVTAGVATLAYDRYLNPAYFYTAIGEQRTIILGDNSVLKLNTDSAARVDIDEDERHIALIRGEAQFAVAKDPSRPFTVQTDNATVRAVGTVFNVRSLTDQTAVAVLEGRVEVASTAALPRASVDKGHGGEQPHVSLSVGGRAAVSSNGEILIDAGPSLERARGWVAGQLTFADEPLGSIVAELNRYRRQPIVISDPAIEGLRISGTFGTNALPDFLEYLQTYRGVKAQAKEGGYILSRAATN